MELPTKSSHRSKDKKHKKKKHSREDDEELEGVDLETLQNEIRVL
jgi:hypothetical protein